MLIVFLVVVVLVVPALLTVAVSLPRMRSRRLRERFGSEYERAVVEHHGSAKEAERDLLERVRRSKKLDVKPLDGAQRERYLTRWIALQEEFVDTPAKAVAGADSLLDEVLREHGYPDEDRIVALSVHHARVARGYRVARKAVERAGQDDAGTEELREAFLRTRETFDDLVRTGGGRPSNSIPTADTAAGPATDRTSS